MSADREANELSQLLDAWTSGDPAARDQLVSIVYDELRRLAHRQMRREREGHVLQTTALVNEACLRLLGLDRMQWRDRSHFFAMAATLMRRVLVDDARQRDRQKRGGQATMVALDEQAVAPERSVDVIALDEALERLAALDARQAKVVELRFFGGLSVEETAGVLAVSPASVKRDWASAKLWLFRELAGSEE